MLRFLPLLLVLLLCTCGPAQNSQVDKESKSQVVGASRHEWPLEKPIKFILDSDTANEIDDLFAIAFLLYGEHPKIDWLGLSSAQWFHVWSGDSTVYQSQQLNEDMLRITDRMNLPHPLGADIIMGKPWGDYDARDSPAAQFIIDQAMALPPDEKMVVMCIGASTNLASAIALKPEITDKIVAYTLGFRYDIDGKFWNKDEFNIRRDLNDAHFGCHQVYLGASNHLRASNGNGRNGRVLARTLGKTCWPRCRKVGDVGRGSFAGFSQAGAGTRD